MIIHRATVTAGGYEFGASAHSTGTVVLGTSVFHNDGTPFVQHNAHVTPTTAREMAAALIAAADAVDAESVREAA